MIESMKDCKYINKYGRCLATREIDPCVGFDKCSQYKIEDKSLTITLPFHTGTHFWVTNLLSGTVCEIEVIGFFVDENLDNVVWSVMASACGGWSAAYEFETSDIGKAVFWNEEDALKAFKKEEY